MSWSPRLIGVRLLQVAIVRAPLGGRPERREMKGRLLGALVPALVALFTSAMAAPVSAAPCGGKGAPCLMEAPAYGTNDAGGFRNVLPPGANGLDNLQQLFQFQGSGQLPPHFVDQQAIYENLLYAAPSLTDAQV